MKTRTGEDSVSVIVGTLLLILITVTAAAGLALMVSQMQKEEMTRQSHLNAVNNELISISNVMFSSDPVAWTAYGPVNNSQYWNNVTITLVNLNTDDVRISGIAVNNQYALNISDKSLSDTTGNPPQIWNFTNPIDIPGTQSQKVYIDFISNSTVDPFIYYRSPQQFDVTQLQDIKILTTLNNFFEKTLKPPLPLAQVQTETDNLGAVQRDALVLDGSQATAENNNTILSWNWTIYDASFTIPPGNWSDVVNWTNQSQPFTGKTVRVTSLNSTPYHRAILTVKDDLGMSATSAPISIPQGNFNPPASLQLAITSPTTCVSNVSGCNYYNNSPFYYPISSSPSSSSITQFNTTLFATLYDINNNPVNNIPVIFIIDNNPNTPQNCFTIFPMASYTNPGGVATTTVMQSNTTSPICPQPITMHAQAGKLLSPTILVPGIS